MNKITKYTEQKFAYHEIQISWILYSMGKSFDNLDNLNSYIDEEMIDL